MIPYILCFLLFWQTSEVPFRAKEDFQIELKYDLKQRPARDPNTVSLDPNVADKKPLGPLPYLIVNVKILNAKAEEIRFKCEDNTGKSHFNRKAEKSLNYLIDMGYIDDLKDRVTPHTFTLYAVTDKKQSLNRIELLVMEDGTFMVNGEKRGKF
jgi:hypothetical protein